MKRDGFTEQECLRKAAKAGAQLRSMTMQNSSEDERDLTAAAVRLWQRRALFAKFHGGKWDALQEEVERDAGGE